MRIPRVAVVVCGHFSLFHLSVPCIIFGDMLPDKKLFELSICGQEPGMLRSEQGMAIEVPHGLEVLDDADIVIIPFWHDPGERPEQSLLDALVAAYSRGAQVVGLCLGTYVLAYAGLLEHHRASTHWEFEQDFVSRFPEVRLDTNALYVDDERLITSAGTGASLDCCLHIVRQHYGSSVANHLARRMVIPPHREGGQAQYIAQPIPTSTQDGRINQLLDHLRQHLSEPHDLDSLAKQVNMSRRTFTRHFHKATGMSLGHWLIAERLRQSQELLESTGSPIEMIAGQVGFQTTTSFRQHFKVAFGVSPSEWRKTFQGD